MQKINYFEALEDLSVMCSRAIFLSFEATRPKLTEALKECEKIQQNATDKVCALEISLFAEFLPPIERHTIAELSHTALKTIEKCMYIMCQKIQRPQNEKKQKYALEITELSQIIEESVFVLKKIKKPNQTPKIYEFRKKASELKKAIRAPHKKQGSYANLTYEMCEELSNFFDKLIEIMLCNI